MKSKLNSKQKRMLFSVNLFQKSLAMAMPGKENKEKQKSEKNEIFSD